MPQSCRRRVATLRCADSLEVVINYTYVLVDTIIRTTTRTTGLFNNKRTLTFADGMGQECQAKSEVSHPVPCCWNQQTLPSAEHHASDHVQCGGSIVRSSHQIKRQAAKPVCSLVKNASSSFAYTAKSGPLWLFPLLRKIGREP